jgi:chemotaxis methyl-accepting protein methylase
MNRGARHDLSHIMFEGKAPTRPQFSHAYGTRSPVLAAAPHAREERLDVFISWVMGRAGLDAAAYRAEPLNRRLPACLRAMKARSTHAGRQLLEEKPHLLARALSSLLIGTTEFFREPGAFDFLRARFLPKSGRRHCPLRIWSAACSTGAELYSMAIVLGEAGLLEQSCLLGTDCRGDAIAHAKLGLYDAAMLKSIPGATRDRYFEPAGQQWRPVEPLRRQVRWKVADLLAGGEEGPWDIILWRNAAIYLKSNPAEKIWRRLASVLAPQGVLVAGKAERPPSSAKLTHVAPCVYRRLP